MVVLSGIESVQILYRVLISVLPLGIQLSTGERYDPDPFNPAPFVCLSPARTCMSDVIRRVWRYQRGNQNPYIEEEQTTQWPKEKGTKGHMSWSFDWRWEVIVCFVDHHCVNILFITSCRGIFCSWLITGFVTRLTWRVSLVEPELLPLPEHPSSPPVFSGVRVTRSLVWYVCFVDRCLSYCTFSFGHCVVYSSSIYEFWLPLWYLQTLLSWFWLTCLGPLVLLLLNFKLFGFPIFQFRAYLM